MPAALGATTAHAMCKSVHFPEAGIGFRFAHRDRTASPLRLDLYFLSSYNPSTGLDGLSKNA